MAAIEKKFSNATLGFNPDELAQRYAEERQKRIRPDAEAHSCSYHMILPSQTNILKKTHTAKGWNVRR